MKKILIVSILLILYSCTPNYKFKITTSRGDTFYCNFFNETDNGCILFNKNPGLNNTPGEPYMFCGKYTVEKIN